VNWDYSLVENEHVFIKSRHVINNTEILSGEQITKLTEYLIMNLNRINAGLLLYLYTGIKLSEICALKDSYLRLEAGTLTVRRTLQRVTMREGSEEQITVEYNPADSMYREFKVPKELSVFFGR
jgi:integrase